MYGLAYHFRIESKHEVTITGGINEFAVKFHGPKGSKSLIVSLLRFFIEVYCRTYYFL